MTRFRFLFYLLLCGFFLIAQRLFTIQVLNSSKTIPLERFVSLSKKDSLRGEIFDRNFKPMVLNEKTYTIYINTKEAQKNDRFKADLLNTLKIKKATMSATLSMEGWPKLKSKVVEKQKLALDKYYPTLVNFEETWGRFYPEGSASAYLLGFVGRDEAGSPKGYLGLEGYYDQELSGMPSVNQAEADLLGVPLIGGVFKRSTDFSGLDIVSTIDLNVQKLMEEELWRGVYKYEAKQGCAIILNPQNGEILALGCVPAFKPSEYNQFTESDFLNPLIASVYEPGSTFKPLIVATALEEKKIKKNTILPEKGPYKIGEYSIRTWDDKYRGQISVQKVLEKSSNVGMVEIISRLQKKTVYKYLDKLGLLGITGVELEGEVSSLIKEQSLWYPIDFATLSFGQGMALTPIELVQAFSTLASDGYLRKPTVIKELVDKRSQTKVMRKETTPKKVFSAKTVAIMKEYLNKSVDNAEALWIDKPKGYKFCGKTGTAQIPISGHYDTSKTIASFIGFFPCQNAQFLILTLYREPGSSPWGSETAAPTFFKIAQKLLLYYNIAPKQ